MVRNEHFDNVSVSDTVSSGSVDTDELNNVYVARPGNLQSTIDTAAANSPAKVKLVPNETYEVTGIEVKRGVTLAFNGAVVQPDQNADIFIVHPDTRILYPRVHTRPLDAFDSVVFRYDTDLVDGFFRDDDTRVVGGMTYGEAGSDTVFLFYQNGNGAVQYVNVENHVISECDVAFDYNSAGGSFITSVNVSAFVGWSRVGVHTHGTGEMYANAFDIVFQVSTDTTSRPETEAAWIHENGRDHIWRGKVWDPSVLSHNHGLWKILSSSTGNNGAGRNNVFWDPSVHNHHLVLDEVGDSSNIVRSGGVVSHGVPEFNNHDYVWRQVDTLSADAADLPVTVDFGGALENYHKLKFSVRNLETSAGELIATVEGAGAGDYGYQLIGGTEQNTQDHWVLVTSGYGRTSGEWKMYKERGVSLSGALSRAYWSQSTDSLWRAGTSVSHSPSQMTIDVINATDPTVNIAMSVFRKNDW